MLINDCNVIRISIVFTYFDDGTTDRFRITYCHLYILSVHNVAVILKYNQVYFVPFFLYFFFFFLSRKKKVYLLSTRNKNLYHCVASTLLEFTKHTQMYICDTGLKSICTQHAIPLLHSKLFCHVLHCFTVFIFVFYCFNRINCNNIFN